MCRLPRSLVPLLAAAPIATAAAQTSPPPSPPAAASVDHLAGGPNFISPMGEPFHSADALSGAEHWFAGADADHDGRLTLAEFRADAQRFFKTLDVDHDGTIGGTEIDRYEEVVAPEIHVVSSASTGTVLDDGTVKEDPYPDRLGAGRYGYIDLPEPVSSMDSNFDRGVSAREYEQALQRRFAALDIDHDGAITRDELPRLRTASDDEAPHRRKHRK